MNRIFTAALLCCLCGTASASTPEKQVVVSINYNGEKKSETFNVKWSEGMTALVALQKCAKIETHPAGDYIFVGDINGVKNVPNVKAWYYDLNGAKTRTLAYKQSVQAGDSVTWNYNKDVCTQLKDKK